MMKNKTKKEERKYIMFSFEVLRFLGFFFLFYFNNVSCNKVAGLRFNTGVAKIVGSQAMLAVSPYFQGTVL